MKIWTTSIPFDLKDMPNLCYDGMSYNALYIAFQGLEGFRAAMVGSRHTPESIDTVYRLAMEQIRLTVLLKMGLHEDEKWQNDAGQLNKTIVDHGGWRVFIETETEDQ